MLLYLHGPDSYRRGARRRELVSRYRAKYPSAHLAQFDMLDTEALPRLAEFLKAPSLFGEERLAIVEGVDGEAEGIAALLRAIPEGEGVVVLLSLPAKLPKPFAFLEKSSQLVEEFTELTGAEFLAFVRREASERGARLTASQAQTLLQAHEGNAWGLVTELDKLALGGAMDDPLALPEFFPLIQLLRHPALARRVAALAVLLEREESAAIFNVAASIAPASQKPAFADYDIAVKSGKLEYAEALTDLVISH